MPKKPKLGLCPIGKFVFSHEDAKKYKLKIEETFNHLEIDYVGIDDVVQDGIVRSHSDVDPAVEHLKHNRVDCVFLPHCNFGTESAAGMIGKQMEVPVLLWGPRDKAPLEDGTRLRDTLCGLFASSKILNKLNVPFTYIDNCELEDQRFQRGIDTFLRAVNVSRKMKHAKIGMVGNRIDFFWSTIINENELLQKFGIEIVPVDLHKVIEWTRERVRKQREAYKKEKNELSTKINLDEMKEEGLLHVLALRDVLFEWAQEQQLSAMVVESFMTITEELGAMISFAQAEVTDRGIPCIVESDIHGAISSIMLEAATFNSKPSFFADLTIRHPDNDNGLLLWHDSFPLSLKDPQSSGSLGKHWILPGINPGTCHWKIKDGVVTIARFDGERGEYRLTAESARSISGPHTLNTYLWVEIERYTLFERHMIKGPYIHHVACIYDNYVDVLREASKYIDGLMFDEIG
jgi:L-fucose isomerase-like protein